MAQTLLETEPARGSTPLVMALNGGALVVAALYFGQEILVPLVLSGLLAFVLTPLVSLLRRAFLPRVAACLLAVLLAFAMIGLLGAIVANQASLLAASLPGYEATVLHKWRALAAGGGWLSQLTGATGQGGSGKGGVAAALHLTDASILSLAGRFAQPLLSPLATAGVVLIFTLFMLLYSEDLRDRFVRLVGRRDLHRTILAMNDAGRRLSRYYLLQLTINASFGLLIGCMLAAIGLPGAILWGILAMMMRFVPFLGTVVALTPPLAVAVAVAPGWSQAFLVFGLFLGAELIMGQAVEPLVYGHSTGLSPVAIILATSFWALIWGLVGLLLATPLTVCLVVIGRHVEALAFFDVLFGDNPPLLPPETFYQRALEHRSAVLETEARQRIKASSLAEYYDRIALPGLVLAQQDRVRNRLDYERLEDVHAQVSALLDRLGETAGQEPASDAIMDAGWSAPGAILCLPGRGQLDDLPGHMAAQVLKQAGFGARTETNLILGETGSMETDESSVRLCCLSVMEAGASASAIRYFIRRIQKRMPEALVAVGLWGADGQSDLLATLRAEGQEEHLVLSIGELLAFVRAVSAQREAEFA